MSEQLLKIINSRRVVRNLTDKPVSRPQLEKILEAGRWAPRGGNQLVQRFLVVQNPITLRLLRMVSPGMFQHPTAVIVICIDWDELAAHQIPLNDHSVFIDIGTTMQNMMLAAHALGLGSGPVTSFSQAAVRGVLNLPEHLTPQLFVCIGYPAVKQKIVMKSKTKITWESMTVWERFENK